MFYRLDSTFEEPLAQGREQEVHFLEDAFTAHRMGNIILVPSRNILRIVEDSPHFGLLSKKTNSYISQKSNDYRSALGAIDRYVVLCHDNRTRDFLIQGREAFVNFKAISQNHILTQSFLMCENMIDAQFYVIITKVYLSETSYPETYFSSRIVAGGGSTLFQSLLFERSVPIKGMVICDADTLGPIPPFQRGTTAHKAYETAGMLQCCNNIGISMNSPMFGFFAGPGLSVENFVGPHLAEQYFYANNRANERAPVSSAFPNFPSLDPVESVLWQSLNLKSGTRSLSKQFDLIKSLFGSVPAGLVARSKSLASASIPTDIMSWTVENVSASRWSRSISVAIAKDLKDRTYFDAVSSLATGMRDLLAGDTGARLM